MEKDRIIMEKDRIISGLIQYPCETSTDWNISRLRELTIDELKEMLEYYRQINGD